MRLQVPASQPLSWSTLLAEGQIDVEVLRTLEQLESSKIGLLLQLNALAQSMEVADRSVHRQILSLLTDLLANASAYEYRISQLSSLRVPLRWAKSPGKLFHWTSVFTTTTPFVTAQSAAVDDQYDYSFSEFLIHRLMTIVTTAIAARTLAQQQIRTLQFDSAEQAIKKVMRQSINGGRQLLEDALERSLAVRVASRRGTHYVYMLPFWDLLADLVEYDLATLRYVQLNQDPACAQAELALANKLVARAAESALSRLPFLSRALGPREHLPFAIETVALHGIYIEHRVLAVVAQVRAAQEADQVCLRGVLKKIDGIYEDLCGLFVGETLGYPFVKQTIRAAITEAEELRARVTEKTVALKTLYREIEEPSRATRQDDAEALVPSLELPHAGSGSKASVVLPRVPAVASTVPRTSRVAAATASV